MGIHVSSVDAIARWPDADTGATGTLGPDQQGDQSNESPGRDSDARNRTVPRLLYWGNAGGGELIVYRVPEGSQDLEAALVEAAAGSPVRFRDAKRSWRALEGIRQEILDDKDFWRREGVAVVSIGIDIQQSCVEVMVNDPQRARPLMAERYQDAVRVKSHAPRVVFVPPMPRSKMPPPLD